jgi:hypothetical protein
VLPVGCHWISWSQYLSEIGGTEKIVECTYAQRTLRISKGKSMRSLRNWYVLTATNEKYEEFKGEYYLHGGVASTPENDINRKRTANES